MTLERYSSTCVRGIDIPSCWARIFMSSRLTIGCTLYLEYITEYSKDTTRYIAVYVNCCRSHYID